MAQKVVKVTVVLGKIVLIVHTSTSVAYNSLQFFGTKKLKQHTSVADWR